MSVVRSVHAVEMGSWADALADALMATSKDAGSTLVDVRTYCDTYEYITAVALLVDDDDPDDTGEWHVGLFAEPPSIGDVV